MQPILVHGPAQAAQPSPGIRRRALVPGVLTLPLCLSGQRPAWATGAAGAADTSAAPASRQTLAAAWRVPDSAGGERDRVGVLAIDWDAARVQVLADHPAPGRAHGLHAMPDGGFIAVANRPGRWLLRCDAQGRVQQRHLLADDGSPHTLGGHALPSADGRQVYTCETDPRTGAGWIGVRDADTLRRIGGFASQGTDPHQMLLADDGSLWVANGGIERLADGRKTAPERMAPSLVQLSADGGQLLAAHRLPDARLSIRHIAWSADGAGRLGAALQAEHDSPDQRRDAPLLAVLQDGRLQLPSADAQGAGYAGDIAAGPGGGFVLSAQMAGRGLWWHPGAAQALTRVAELGEPCALAAFDGGRGVLMAARLGAARWHVHEAPRMLRWPTAMAPDNHWLLLADGA